MEVNALGESFTPRSQRYMEPHQANANILHKLGPRPPYGRRTYTGLSGQNTVLAGTFWGVLNASLCASYTQLRLLSLYFFLTTLYVFPTLLHFSLTFWLLTYDLLFQYFFRTLLYFFVFFITFSILFPFPLFFAKLKINFKKSFSCYNV